MARPPRPLADPAADAASLLRRIAFGTLMFLVPLTALVARRAVVVLAPIGIILLVIAALLDGDHRSWAKSARDLTGSLAGLAGALVLAWCALSLLWTPFVEPASERLTNIAATLAVAVAGYVSLPERMRSANLYLVTLGAGIAAGVAVMLAVFGSRDGPGPDNDGQSLERGLVVLVMIVWPAIAWLRSRGRNLEASVLGLLVVVAALLGSPWLAFPAFAAGAIAFAATFAAPRLGVRATAWTMAGLLALAPGLPLIAGSVPLASLGLSEASLASLAVWRDIVTYEPARLITGHGFETALRNRLIGILPLQAPSTLVFEIWYELGIVGAWAGAVALYMAVRAAGRSHPALVPGAMAAFVTAFGLAGLGIGTAQMWWFTTLAIVVLIFVAAERGQFRTTRPKANLSRANVRPDGGRA